MSQLTDNLSAIAAIKSDIAAAIESKGVSMSGVSFGSYADKIGEIQTGGTFVTETLSVSVNNTYYPGQGVDGFSQVTVNVPQSVTGWTEKDLTEGMIQVTSLNNSASFVASSNFLNNLSLTTVNLPNCTFVGTNAFRGCTNLSSVSMPILSTISSSAFQQCGIEIADFPFCETIGNSAFAYCSSLLSVNLPKVGYIVYDAFTGCSSLTTAILSSCTDVFSRAFNRCRNLQELSLPVCRTIGDSAFNGCKKLPSLNLPSCTYIGISAFNGCDLLSVVSLSVCEQIGSYAFRYATTLSNIYIYTGQVCSLVNTNAFFMSPIESNTGSIYVPASLVEEYKSATNWSVFSSQIFPIP